MPMYQHDQGHADRGRRVETQGHRGHVSAPRSLGQSKRQPGVDQIAKQHAERSAGKHPGIDNIGGESEDEHQRASHERQDGQVVEHEAEESVHVSERKPGVPCRRRTHVVHAPPIVADLSG